MLLQIVYYDGQFNDSRMNVLLACTAARVGATVLNHAEVTKFLKVCPCLKAAWSSQDSVAFWNVAPEPAQKWDGRGSPRANPVGRS